MKATRWSDYFFPIFMAGLYAFLYLPLIILIIFSFNDNRMQFNWVGFTTRWYQNLWVNSEIWHALYNSLIVASSAVIISLSMCSLFIFFGQRATVKRWLSLFYLNLAIPEIVLAVGLMSLFYFFSIPLSLTTLIAAHSVLGLGYVVPIMYDRYSELDQRYMEASMDLGATQWQTFKNIILPLLMPAITSSALLVFIVSFEDFSLSFFCAGGSTVTLPLYIFARIRSGSSPVVSALSAVLLMISSVIVMLFLFPQFKRRGRMR
jgi:spermidine/putrescine transport system permease protein